MADKLRTFVAVEVPQEAKNSMGKLAESLRQRGMDSVRWVRPQGIHLTLKFLGNVEPSQVGNLLKAIRNAASDARAFALNLAEPGVFPNPRNTRVVWVGLGGNLEALGTLQKGLESHIKSLGFPPEARAFTPHLTLGRIHGTPPPQELATLAQALKEEGNGPEATWRVKKIHLIQSTLTPQGAIYTTLGTESLSD